MSKANELASVNQKNNTVAELYALRAGLSVISERADDIRSLESDMEAEYRRTKPIQDEIDENNRKIMAEREEADRLKQSIVNIEANKSKKVKSFVNMETEGTYHYASIYISDYKIFIIPGALLIVWGIFMLAMFKYLWAIGVIIVGAGLVVIPIIVAYKKAQKGKRLRQSAASIKTQEIEIDIADLQKQIENTYARVAAIQRENEELNLKKKELSAEIEQRVLEIRNDIAPIVQEVSLYNNALETKYTGLLNPADWKNTDLCIFYLQSGRADSIKECLQLVDRQRQNDEIVGAIKDAGDRISCEINSGFKALGSTIVSCINALSMQIDTLENSLEEQNKATVQALGAIEKSNAELLSESRLNNALQAKANETSEKLLRDYRYVQNGLSISI